MQAYIILGVLLGLPFLLGLIFRVGVSNLFVALLSGELLARYFTDDAQLALGAMIHNEAVMQYVGLGILILPMILTAVLMQHTLSRGKAVLHTLPLIISGAVFAAFAAPLLPGGLRSQLSSNHYGHILLDSAELIIGAMILLQLAAMWLFGRPSEKGKHGKH